MNLARRIVIDNGIMVSAAICPESIPALAVEKAWLQFDECASDENWAELQTVLMRSKFDRYFTPELRQAVLQGFRQRTVSFAVTESVTDCADPKDNKFLALAAAAAEAELTLASDIHLTTIAPLARYSHSAASGVFDWHPLTLTPWSESPGEGLLRDRDRDMHPKGSLRRRSGQS